VQPGAINPIRIESPKICQMDFAGFTKGKREIRTLFQRYLPTKSNNKKMIISVINDTNACLAVNFSSSGTGLLFSPSNVSVTK
jgi:hypothetical protein